MERKIRMEQTVSFELENHSPLAVLHLNGYLAQLEVYKFKAQVEKLAAEFRYMIFDMDHLAFIDSAGIGALVQIRAELLKFGGALVLAAPNSPHVKSAFNSSQLGRVIPCFVNVEDARQFLAEKFGLKNATPEDELAGQEIVGILHQILDRLGSIEGRLERMENR
jgi:anti-anti-sigma factor